MCHTGTLQGYRGTQPPQGDSATFPQIVFVFEPAESLQTDEQSTWWDWRRGEQRHSVQVIAGRRAEGEQRERTPVIRKGFNFNQMAGDTVAKVI